MSVVFFNQNFRLFPLHARTSRWIEYMWGKMFVGLKTYLTEMVIIYAVNTAKMSHFGAQVARMVSILIWMAAVCSRCVAGGWSKMAHVCEVVILPCFNKHLLAYTLRAFGKQSRWFSFALLWAKGRKDCPDQPEALGKGCPVVRPCQAGSIAPGSLV